MWNVRSQRQHQHACSQDTATTLSCRTAHLIKHEKLFVLLALRCLRLDRKLVVALGVRPLEHAAAVDHLSKACVCCSDGRGWRGMQKQCPQQHTVHYIPQPALEPDPRHPPQSAAGWRVSLSAPKGTLAAAPKIAATDPAPDGTQAERKSRWDTGIPLRLHVPPNKLPNRQTCSLARLFSAQRCQ